MSPFNLRYAVTRTSEGFAVVMAANTQQTAANTYIPFHWSPFGPVSQIIQYYGATSIHLWQRRQYSTR